MATTLIDTSAADGAQPYPLDIRGELSPQLSRGLWLVKWILAIPHFFVLSALILAAVVVSISAFFAILFTARYPRRLFDFVVGVSRWVWRVSFYCLAPLGTDRYPPFSLASSDDYPADLHVEYPERLSRLKVLFKWWLLAIPHYLVLISLNGGGDVLDDYSYVLNHVPLVGDAIAMGLTILTVFGLVHLLAMIAMVAKLFSGRYPSDIFDLLMGLQRYQMRVSGYIWLLYDNYPPFRLGR